MLVSIFCPEMWLCSVESDEEFAAERALKPKCKEAKAKMARAKKQKEEDEKAKETSKDCNEKVVVRRQTRRKQRAKPKSTSKKKSKAKKKSIEKKRSKQGGNTREVMRVKRSVDKEIIDHFERFKLKAFC